MLNSQFVTRLALGFFLLSISFLAHSGLATIDFDKDAGGATISAPSLISAATPLTDLYASQGATFSALDLITQPSIHPVNGVLRAVNEKVRTPSDSEMGGILNDQSGFGKSAHSGENFLAFNGESDFSAHVWRINFDSPIGYFGIQHSRGMPLNDDGHSHGHGHGNDRYLIFEAFDGNDNFLGVLNHVNNPDDNYSFTSFKSDTAISYIDIAHGQECCSSSIDESIDARPPWALVYDDLVFGNFGDAPAGTHELGETVIPIPGAIWMFLSGIAALCPMIVRKKPFNRG